MFINERSSFHGFGILFNLHGHLEFRPEGDGLDDCRKKTLKQTGCRGSDVIYRDCSAGEQVDCRVLRARAEIGSNRHASQ
jgi:hypothetical protein